MPKLPQIEPRKIEKVLLKLGFRAKQGKGSHLVFKHEDSRRTVLPVHNRPVSLGTLRSILRQVEITADAFLELL